MRTLAAAAAASSCTTAGQSAAAVPGPAAVDYAVAAVFRLSNALPLVQRARACICMFMPLQYQIHCMLLEQIFKVRLQSCHVLYIDGISGGPSHHAVQSYNKPWVLAAVNLQRRTCRTKMVQK
jgi:hypothetical protein